MRGCCQLRRLLEDHSAIEVGRLRLHTVLTPGHTAGSMCFRLDGASICSRATLFPAVPATPAAGGNFPLIIEPIESRLFSLPGHHRVSVMARDDHRY
jgi:glyoxylase-like metal-dependent hydrolase (beta-lactamase superfamily II)